MKTIQFAVVVAAVAGFALLGFRRTNADPPAPQPGNGSERESLDLRCARLHVQLAEAGLKRVQAMNQRLAKTVSADVVAAYQHDLDVAKLRLKLASPDAKGNHFDLWLERARADAAADEAVWRAADTANQKSPGVVDPNEVERLRLAFELDKLELQRGEALASGPVEGRVEWELCLVNTEIQRLKGQLRSSAIGGGMNPVLGY